MMLVVILLDTLNNKILANWLFSYTIQKDNHGEHERLTTKVVYMRSVNPQDVKKIFLDYMQNHNHLKISGASIIPKNDPSLLFINAGMAPMKAYFSGQKTPPQSDLCNVQPCIRTIDIDDVGDMHHLTMFEMLGSWSINNYFKQKSIELAYDLLVNHYQFSKDRLYATVYGGNESLGIPADTESADFWKQVGLPETHIVILKNDNFWSAGNTGPCGPCTEVFFDTENQNIPSYHETGVFDTKHRYMEIWNAGVFMQYNRNADGSLETLPFKSVDTGAGFERLTMALNGKKSVYDTEIFSPYMTMLNTEINGNSAETTRAKRIIADHIRAATLIISEGVFPGKEGQNYIPRKLIRRAMTESAIHTESKLKFEDIANIAIVQLNLDYPIVGINSKRTLDVLNGEMNNFQKTLNQGMKYFNKISRNTQTVTGKQIFDLQTSFGLPFDFIAQLAKKSDKILEVDIYKKLLAEHKMISKNSLVK